MLAAMEWVAAAGFMPAPAKQDNHALEPGTAGAAKAVSAIARASRHVEASDLYLVVGRRLDTVEYQFCLGTVIP